MEQLVSLVASRLGPDIGLIAGLAAIAAIFFPTLIRAWEVWLDVRTGKRNMAAEKTRLELMKLHYEIAALKKQHDLPTIPGDTTSVPENAAVNSNEKQKEISAGLGGIEQRPLHTTSSPWSWLVVLHRINSGAALGVAYAFTVIVGFVASIFVLSSIAILLDSSSRSEIGLLMLMMDFLFVIMAYATGNQIRKLRKLEKKAGQTNTQSAH